MMVRTKGFAALVGAAVVAGALSLGAGGAGAGPAGGPGRATTSCQGDEVGLAVVGLTSDDRLVCFNELRAHRTTTIGAIRGLTVDTELVGIDFRPADGTLVGVGDRGGLYVVDPRTAAAQLVSRLTVALSGTSFGVDFNPVVDRLRIVSNTGQNLRANVADGATVVDGPLAYVPAPGQPSTPAQGISAAAYTNNDSDPNTSTTLFDIDSALDQVVIQSPANAGLLSPTGKLLTDAPAEVGFDIYSHVRGGTTVLVRGLAVAPAGGKARLHLVDLLTGTARLIGIPNAPVVDLAIPLDQ